MNIDKIIENFDFEKVRAYMKINRWTYWDKKETPSIEELKNVASFILSDCMIEIKKTPNEFHWASTGGFKAFYCPISKSLRLEFIIESYAIYHEKSYNKE